MVVFSSLHLLNSFVHPCCYVPAAQPHGARPVPPETVRFAPLCLNEEAAICEGDSGHPLPDRLLDVGSDSDIWSHISSDYNTCPPTCVAAWQQLS